MYFEAVFSFYVLLYHFVGHSFLGLVLFGSFSDIIKRNFSLTFAKLNFYVDMSVWLFVGKQYYRLNAVCAPELVDACVYEINAELSRYDYLLRQIKERGGEAVCKTCSEGVAKWG